MKSRKFKQRNRRYTEEPIGNRRTKKQSSSPPQINEKTKKTKKQLSLNGLKSRMEMADERVSELEDKSIKLGNQKKEKKILKNKNKKTPRDLQNNNKKSNVYASESQREKMCNAERSLNKNV